MKKNLILLALVSLSFMSCKEEAEKNNDNTTNDTIVVQSDAVETTDGAVVLSNSSWRLVKLNGKAIEKNKDEERELGIIFSTDGRFSGYAGCNNMMGDYELKEAENQIKFSKVGMTMMACPDSSMEKELAEVLELADNYNFDGETLKLNKAKMAPIAEFEIIK
ncbi:META domain-containing protein [Flavobacterium ardleyense]|uniref:META domain-containing protein n=1 Tax=Flavobacterium ardleyense TaxID=2038737 RepID=A0ABW5Z5C4_9FLAO